MKRLRIAVAGAALATELPACELLPTLPDQTAVGPLELDGLQSGIDFAEAAISTGSGGSVPSSFVNRDRLDQKRSPDQPTIEIISAPALVSGSALVPTLVAGEGLFEF